MKKGPQLRGFLFDVFSEAQGKARVEIDLGVPLAFATGVAAIGRRMMTGR